MATIRCFLRHVSRAFSSEASRNVVAVNVPYPNKAEVEFDDGKRFVFSAEFLRVYSPAADSKRRSLAGETKAVSGRRYIGIMSVNAVGNYGVRFVFDDLHKTGIYSWDYLYHLGENKFSLMRQYIRSLRAQGLSRDPRTPKANRA